MIIDQKLLKIICIQVAKSNIQSNIAIPLSLV